MWGKLDRLVVEHSVFFRGHDGHYVKSRALRTEVTGCTIGDGEDGTASYEIEAPNGGALLVRGNRIEKGPKTGNQETAISIGAEGVTQSHAGDRHRGQPVPQRLPVPDRRS